MIEKPFAPSCERNQQALLDELKKIISPQHKNLLEIGTGTAQHAIFMAPHFNHLRWHTSDLKAKHDGIIMWLEDNPSANIMPPITYESGQSPFPTLDIDVIFTANTLHIMPWESVQAMIKDFDKNLNNKAEIIIYGPFNHNGQYTSSSNEDFDHWLKDQNQHSAIRDFEALNTLMQAASFELFQNIDMPANNHLLHFIKKTKVND